VKKRISQKKVILLDRNGSKENETEASLDWYGLVYLHEQKFNPESYEFYKNILREFIHLDMLKTTGSAYGHGGPKPGENLSYKLTLRIEDEITRECDLLIEQKSLLFRFLKSKFHC